MHKTNMPIRSVVNKKYVPAHKPAKSLNTQIEYSQIFPKALNDSKSVTTAEDFIRLNIMSNNKIINLDINDLYTNLLTF